MVASSACDGVEAGEAVADDGYAVLRGTGGDLLLVPRMDRRSLFLIDSSANEPILGEFPIPALIDGDVTLRCLSHNVIATAPLEDGRSEMVTIRREGVSCR